MHIDRSFGHSAGCGREMRACMIAHARVRACFEARLRPGCFRFARGCDLRLRLPLAFAAIVDHGARAGANARACGIGLKLPCPVQGSAIDARRKRAPPVSRALAVIGSDCAFPGTLWVAGFLSAAQGASAISKSSRSTGPLACRQFGLVDILPLARPRRRVRRRRRG